MNRTELLETANKIVNGARQNNYGSPENCFQTIADFWNTYFIHKKSCFISPKDVAAMMVLMKVSRLCNDINHEDSWIDIAGYAANGVEVSDGKGDGDVGTVSKSH
jgi:hypothetical protein